MVKLCGVMDILTFIVNSCKPATLLITQQHDSIKVEILSIYCPCSQYLTNIKRKATHALKVNEKVRVGAHLVLSAKKRSYCSIFFCLYILALTFRFFSSNSFSSCKYITYICIR